MQVSVSTLVDRVLTSIDMEDGFTTPAMVVRWLNAAHPRFIFMLQISGWVNSPSEYRFTATGADAYPLPAQAMSVAGVWRDYNGRHWELPSENSLTPIDSIQYEYPRAYRVTDAGATTVVSLNPSPVGGNYVVRYFPNPPELVLATPGIGQADSINYPAGWEEWLVLEVARQASGREETNNSTIGVRQKEVEADVCRMAEERLFANGPSIRNVDGITQPGWQTSSLLWLGSRRGSGSGGGTGGGGPSV
jgi:hypothetical protein